MIVYGDPAREEPLPALVEGLRAAISRAMELGAPLESVRRVLVQAGEMEQAMADAPPESLPDPDVSLHVSRTVTSRAAQAFHFASRVRPDRAQAMRRLGALRSTLHSFPAAASTVQVKVPEGFAFYALYPDLYALAARSWARAHQSERAKDALVIGIRSIGTTLSAVLEAELLAVGWRVRRRTTRPQGHPLQPGIDERWEPAAWGLVVDDGPGRSGSSMLAAAAALERSGVERVHLFPGDARGPGEIAGAEQKALWSRYPRHVVALDGIRFEGSALAEALWRSILARDGDAQASSSRDPGISLDPLGSVEDWGGGAWRARIFSEPGAWPDAPRQLERPKLLLTGASGRRVLCKFEGIATAPGASTSLAEERGRRLDRLSSSGLVPRLLGHAHGFLTSEWIEGRTMAAWDACPAIQSAVGEYIARAAGPPLIETEAQASWERTRRMVEVNVAEALGEEALPNALEAFRDGPPPASFPSAGDGHLAPHEWVLTAGGALVKADAGGHEIDHTWVGSQPVLWDLAAATLEWKLKDGLISELLEGYAHIRETVPRAALESYLVAYAAHRTGQAALFAQAETDENERARLDEGYRSWIAALRELLSHRHGAGARDAGAA